MERLKLAIRYAVFVGGLIVYAYLYFTFLRDILDADGKAPDLENGAVQLASGIGGVLAAVFAVAFGIQRRDPTVNQRKLNLGRTLTPNAEVVTGLCVVVYFVVGLATAAVALTNSPETPQEIKTPLTLFVGYLGAMFTAIATSPKVT
jgi:hypothetical protein